MNEECKFCKECGGLLEKSNKSSTHYSLQICIETLKEKLEYQENKQKKLFLIKAYTLDKGYRYGGTFEISAFSRKEAIDEFKSRRWVLKLIADDLQLTPLGKDCYHIECEPKV